MEEEQRLKTLYHCPFCDYSIMSVSSTYENAVRAHIRHSHKTKTKKEIYRIFYQEQFPGLDIDKVITRYKEKVETVFSLSSKRIFIGLLLKALGILRKIKIDINLGILHKEGNQHLQSSEDLREDRIRRLRIGHASEAFKPLSDRKLKKKGYEDPNLYDAVRAIVHIEKALTLQKRMLHASALLNNAPITMVSLKRERTWEETRIRLAATKKKKYVLNPEGKITEYRSVVMFCTEQGEHFSRCNFLRMLRGKRSMYLGWKIVPPEMLTEFLINEAKASLEENSTTE